MATEYSRLAIVSGLAKFPATLQTNRSPLAVSKAYSGAMRKSAQLKMLAYGFCPPTSASRSCLKSWRRDTPSWQAAMPVANADEA